MNTYFQQLAARALAPGMGIRPLLPTVFAPAHHAISAPTHPEFEHPGPDSQADDPAGRGADDGIRPITPTPAPTSLGPRRPPPTEPGEITEDSAAEPLRAPTPPPQGPATLGRPPRQFSHDTSATPAQSSERAHPVASPSPGRLPVPFNARAVTSVRYRAADERSAPRTPAITVAATAFTARPNDAPASTSSEAVDGAVKGAHPWHRDSKNRGSDIAAPFSEHQTPSAPRPHPESRTVAESRARHSALETRPAPEPGIQVTIGRLEIRAQLTSLPPPSPVPTAAAPSPRISLGEHLRAASPRA